MTEVGTVGVVHTADAAPGSTRALIDSLQARVVTTVGGLLPPGTTDVALIDFPYHRNSGDSLIWHGERSLLDRLNIRAAYVADSARYRGDRLREALPEGPILLDGGGNFGDLWPGHHELRLQVLRDFPDRLVVQLPQSIRFRRPESIPEARKAFEAHKNFVLVVRERRSLAFARENFSVPVVLSPDMAFAIGPMKPPRPVRAEGVLCLARSDHEGTGVVDGVVGPGIRRVDWEMPKVPELRWKLARTFPQLERRVLGHRAALYRAARPALYTAYGAMARECVDTASSLLCSARYVVTDRLHAHVLSLLLGIPHTVLDNNYGKISGTYEAWTSGSDIVHWATSAEEALAQCSQYII